MSCKRLIFGKVNATALGAIVAACVLPVPANAAGGKDIGSAPIVAYDQSQFGNTATDSDIEQCNEKDSWWLLPVASGDRITIDFEGEGVKYARVWPVGTTDFNIESTNYVDERESGSNGKGELVVKASQTGTMPLSFSNYDCDFGDSVDPGPYDFTAYIKHGVRVAIPHRDSRPRRGTLAVTARTPDGGTWKRLGSASVSHSVANIAYSFLKSTRGKKVDLRAVASGDAYTTATSPTDHLTIR